MKNLCGASLKFCQFPSQPAKIQKAAPYFVDIPERQFHPVPATCAIINVPEDVLNNVFRCAEKLAYLAILQAARDQERRPELHWCQESC